MKIYIEGPGRAPQRAHDYDTGADVFSPIDIQLEPEATEAIDLLLSVKIPPGFAGFVYPRTSLTAKGILCHLPPIDSGYTGSIHAFLTNTGPNCYRIREGDRIGQLVILPVVIPEIVYSNGHNHNACSRPQRGDGAFGSTGR